MDANGAILGGSRKTVAEEATVRHVMLDAAQQKCLFERTAGLPLPIKLSVARIAGGETFDQVVRWLGNAVGDLPEYCVKGQIDLARQRNPNAWKLLLACSLFDRNAGASREALGYVADLSLADRDDGLTLLQRLSLINRTDRFWLLPIVRDYAGTGVQKELWGEFTGYFHDMAHNLLGQVREPQDAYWWMCLDNWQQFGTVELEVENVLSAIMVAHDQQNCRQVRELVVNSVHLFWYEGRGKDRVQICRLAARSIIRLRRTRESYSESDATLRIDLAWLHLDGCGWVYLALREFDRAKREIRIGKMIAESVGAADDAVDAIALADRFLAQIAIEEGQLEEAEQCLSRLYHGSHCRPRIQSRIRTTLGYLQLQQHQPKSACQYLEEALEISSNIGTHAESGEKGEWLEMAWILYWLSQAYLAGGDPTKAIASLMRAEQLINATGDKVTIAFVRLGFARVYAATGQIQPALQAAEEAQDRFERLGMRVELGQVKNLLHELT